MDDLHRQFYDQYDQKTEKIAAKVNEIEQKLVINVHKLIYCYRKMGHLWLRQQVVKVVVVMAAD
jgi:hypothetical protein